MILINPFRCAGCGDELDSAEISGTILCRDCAEQVNLQKQQSKVCDNGSKRLRAANTVKSHAAFK